MTSQILFKSVSFVQQTSKCSKYISVYIEIMNCKHFLLTICCKIQHKNSLGIYFIIRVPLKSEKISDDDADGTQLS